MKRFRSYKSVKHAVDSGEKVHWKNTLYSVYRDNTGRYIVRCDDNGSQCAMTEPGEFRDMPRDFFTE